MSRQEFKASAKLRSKITKDGLIEQNAVTGEDVRISKREVNQNLREIKSDFNLSNRAENNTGRSSKHKQVYRQHTDSEPASSFNADSTAVLNNETSQLAQSNESSNINTQDFNIRETAEQQPINQQSTEQHPINRQSTDQQPINRHAADLTSARQHPSDHKPISKSHAYKKTYAYQSANKESGKQNTVTPEMQSSLIHDKPTSFTEPDKQSSLIHDKPASKAEIIKAEHSKTSLPAVTRAKAHGAEL